MLARQQESEHPRRHQSRHQALVQTDTAWGCKDPHRKRVVSVLRLLALVHHSYAQAWAQTGPHPSSGHHSMLEFWTSKL